jgi:radical SAM superfamily enzyme YgiQ (UPF0313 family)
MLQNEVCLLPNQPKNKGALGCLWYYPNSYKIGMAGLGYQLVWKLLQEDPDIVVQRGFTDWLEPHQVQQPTELIGFTLSWELDFVNILKTLSEHGIPFASAEREDDLPIVFGGGPVLSANPEPFADFFDVVLLGDAEKVVPSFLQGWKEARKGTKRLERLQYLSTIDGIYVPSFYSCSYEGMDGPLLSTAPIANRAPARVLKQTWQPPPEYVAHSVLLSPDTTWGDMFLVEIVRSCPQECRFCLASFLTRPFRATKVEAILRAVDLGLAHTKKIGLLGPSVTEHPQFDQIADGLLARPQTNISIASIRADTVTDNVLYMLKELGQRSLTIAIESGSERLRSVMKKNLSNDEIENAVDKIASQGFGSIKLYGIAGLPEELPSDLDQTVALLRKLKKTHRQLRIVFGVSSFVPKAQTPFQKCGRDRTAAKKIEYLRKRLAEVGIDVRPESHNWSDIQTLLSRGDRRLAPVLMDVASGNAKLGDWKRAMKRQTNIPDFDFYVYRNMEAHEILPWSHLMDEQKMLFLDKHLEQAVIAASPEKYREYSDYAGVSDASAWQRFKGS